VTRSISYRKRVSREGGGEREREREYKAKELKKRCVIYRSSNDYFSLVATEARNETESAEKPCATEQISCRKN